MNKDQFEKAIGHDHVNERYEESMDHDQVGNLNEQRIEELSRELQRLRREADLSYQISQTDIQKIASKINQIKDNQKIQQIKNNL
jgi:hypothetical protein